MLNREQPNFYLTKEKEEKQKERKFLKAAAAMKRKERKYLKAATAMREESMPDISIRVVEVEGSGIQQKIRRKLADRDADIVKHARDFIRDILTAI